MTPEEEKLFFDICNEFNEELINSYIELFDAINDENFEKAALIRDIIRVNCLDTGVKLNENCGLPLKRGIKHCKSQSKFCLDEFTKQNKK